MTEKREIIVAVSGLIVNVNLLTLIITAGWAMMGDLITIAYPGWVPVQALCLCTLSLTVQPLSSTLYEQMWERFFFSSSIIAYLAVLWLLSLGV